MQFLCLRAARFSACAAISYFFLLLAPGQLYASQSDTLKVDLGEVYIEASRLAVPWNLQPVNVSLVDSAAASRVSAQTLGDALRFSSPVQIRTYGLGGMQSVSARGFGPGQTQLMWNGFSVNHTMLGVTDYALVPASFTGNLRVVSGSGSAGFGERWVFE